MTSFPPINPVSSPFGQTSTTGTGSPSIFGNPAPPGQTSTNTFAGFGANASQTQQAQAPPPSLFGQPATNAQPQTAFGTGNLFGSQQAAAPAAAANAGGFNFGASTATNNTATAQPAKPTFGGFTGFGNTSQLSQSTTNPLNPTQNQNQNQNQQSTTQNPTNSFQPGSNPYTSSLLKSNEKSIAERFSAVIEGIHFEQGQQPGPGYRMTGYTYNVHRDATAPARYDPRLDADQVTLREARSENPDPTRLVPVYIVGHNELQSRISLQKGSRDQQAEYLQHISQRVTTSATEIHSHLEPRRDAASRSLQVILGHLIQLYSRIALMSQLMRSNEVTEAEEAFRGMLDKVVRAFEKSSKGGRLQGRLAEDWGRVMALKAEVESGRLGGRREGRSLFLSDETLIQALDGQTQELAALTHLTKDLKYDSQVVGVLAKELA